MINNVINRVSKTVFSNSTSYKIVGHNICPYVQRVLIVLIEKNIDFEKFDIDLDFKPDWFFTISPTNKVPVLITNKGQSIFESSVICEYLDDVSSGSLYQDSPDRRAHEKSWISYGGDILNIIANIIYKDRSEKELLNSSESIKSHLLVMEDIVEGTPYFNGETFSVIDGVYATIFRYFDFFSPILNFDFTKDMTRINKWRGFISERMSVQNSVPSDYQEILRTFIKSRNSYISTII